MKPHICFFGLMDLPVLAPGYRQYSIGGEEVQHTLLARALVKRGYRVSMVVADLGQQDGAQWDGVTTYKAYRLDEGLPLLRFLHPRWSKAWAALARADADVYYGSSAGMHIGMLAMFCSSRGRRLVYRVASDADTDPARLRKLVHYARDRALYRYGLRRADAILVQTEPQQESLLSHFGCVGEMAGMLLDWPQRLIGRSQRTIDVLWVGKLHPVKRPELILDLAREVPDVQIYVVGGDVSGYGELHADFKAGVSRLGNVRHYGRVAYQDVGELYDQARIFVNTSELEGFPNTYLQAWARGTPVVAFFDPGGLIRREGLGVVVATIDEMAAAVKRLLGNPDELAMMGECCREYMQRRYDEDELLQPYIAAFGNGRAG